MALPAGADSLIAPRSKAASAGVILALAAAAALILAGCGGGDGAGSPATTASAPGSVAAKHDGDATSSSSSSSSSSAGKDQGSQPPSDNPAATPTPTTGAGKQGSSIPEPKGKRERGPTPAEEAEATVADIALWSPALGSASGETSALPSTYTCDGKNSWPELRWRGVPPDTKELAILAMSVAPVEGKLIFDWAVAGLDPSLEGIEAAKLPRGAVSGQNSFGKNGYEICPSGSETYVFALFALPTALSPPQGFDPHDFREEVLGLSGNAGLLAVSYARG